MKQTSAGDAARARFDVLTLARVNAALQRNDQMEACRELYEGAKRQGAAKVAARAGMQRPAMHHALNQTGNPTLGTLLAILHAMGLGLAVIGQETE